MASSDFEEIRGEAHRAQVGGLRLGVRGRREGRRWSRGGDQVEGAQDFAGDVQEDCEEELYEGGGGEEG